MRNEFLAAFEAELATVERVVEPPTTAPGWGSDLSCADDLTADMLDLDGNDPLIVAQYTYRRITTPAGELPDDSDWGCDLKGRLSSGMSEADIRELQSELLGEIARDDRLQNVRVTATFNAPTESLAVKIWAEIVDSDNEFSLTAVTTRSGSNLLEVLINGRPAS